MIIYIHKGCKWNILTRIHSLFSGGLTLFITVLHTLCVYLVAVQTSFKIRGRKSCTILLSFNKLPHLLSCHTALTKFMMTYSCESWTWSCLGALGQLLRCEFMLKECLQRGRGKELKQWHMLSKSKLDELCNWDKFFMWGNRQDVFIFWHLGSAAQCASQRFMWCLFTILLSKQGSARFQVQEESQCFSTFQFFLVGLGVCPPKK